MDKLSQPFWLDDPKVLYQYTDIIPTQKMTNTERLNAATRLLILITIALLVMGNSQAFTIFGLGLLLILVMKNTQKEGFRPRRGRHDPCNTCGFDSNMAYINTKYETSPIQQYTHDNDGLRSYVHAHYKVIPIDTPQPFRETWRKEARWCNEFSQYPQTYNIVPEGGDLMQPTAKCNYPDRMWIDNTPTGRCDERKFSARPAIQSAFMTDSLTFRNNIMGEYIDQFARCRNYSCVGFKPGRKTF